MAHGGWCVARHDGQVVFVRGTLPGEQVRATVTDMGPQGRFVRAQVDEVIEASRERVVPPCPHSADCGGCDWQHASIEVQRRMKAEVLAEQLLRLAGVTWEGEVEAVPGDDHGLRWRTRMRFAVDDEGHLGLRRHRSHEVVRIGACPIAHPLLAVGELLTQEYARDGDVEAECSVATGERWAGRAGQPRVLAERAAGRDWRVSGGFWQVHPGAAETLVATVAEQLSPRPGEHLLDLYAGVGLFAGALAPSLGPGGRVDVVEADAVACADASANLADLPWVRVHRAAVVHQLRRGGLRRADLVVLDPPRSGAGREVCERLAALGPRAVSYVACDPASLARDVATLARLGYRLLEVRAFDLFPMTHHLESVALLVPAG